MEDRVMVITPDPELEAALTAAAQKQGVDPADLAVEILRQRLLRRRLPFEPRDEWERRLLSIGTDCGVSPPDSAFTSEEMYEPDDGPRTPGLHAGAIQAAEDFDAPLPDEFWAGRP
jgi:hypothetical protein